MSIELHAGYKQTEVGVIPEDWNAEPMGAITTDIGDGLHGTPVYSSNGGYYFINGNNLRDGKIVVTNETKTVDYTEFAKNKKKLSDRSILMSINGTIGNLGMFGGEPVVLGKSAAYLNVKESASKRFVFYLLQTEIVRCQFFDGLTGSTIGNLGLKTIRNTKVPLPPTKSEQEAIAEALSEADALITSLEQLIAKKRHIKQGAMQELLTGKKRLPGFLVSGKFTTNQLGTYPTEWNLFRLKDLVDPFRSIRYGIVQPGQYEQNGRFMIRGQDYSESKGWAKPEDVFRVSEDIEARYKNARVQTNDLIMTIVGYCGHVEVIPNWLNEANLTQTTARIAILPSKAVSIFCKYMLQSTVGRNQVGAFIKGAAQPGLNCGDVEEFLLPLPSLAEQSAIAAILSDLDAEIAELEAQLSKTHVLKQGMMHKLLTGEIRLI
jgi:type I restriction enzyme S subunit